MAASATSEGVNLGIIITPMLDMAFQILAFFIMTFHPAALEGHIDGKLLPPVKDIKIAGPGSPEKDKKDKTSVKIDEDVLDKLNDTLEIVVKSVRKGQQEDALQEGEPTRIELRLPEDGGKEPNDDRKFIIDRNAVRTDEQGQRVLVGFEDALKKLKAKLEEVQKKSGDVPGMIRLDIDPDLRHGYLVRVYDVCRGAGFRGIGFAPAQRSR
jgi:biopolymer transport protein ExbD